jgi:hypothetical protein
MKRSQYNPHRNKFYLISIFLLTLFSFQYPHAYSQPANLPVVTVRFANPQFDCSTYKYCLDVEFQSDSPNVQLFGMNIRFFYDDAILEYLYMDDFEQGYQSTRPPEILTDNIACADKFGFEGPLEWFNGTVQRVSASPVFISTNGWTKLFSICFHVDKPLGFMINDFCPSIVWDMELSPALGGFQKGNDGVVMTIADRSGQQNSAPSLENVVQFNWSYDENGNRYGTPESTNCLSQICGHPLPLSDWAIYLAIGLMLISSVLIYKNRISGSSS